MRDEVVLRFARRRAMPGAAVMLVFVGANVLLIGSNLLALRVLGAIGVVFYGLLALISIAMLVHPAVVATINSDGVRLGGGMRPLDRMLPWSSIAAVRIYSRTGMRIGSPSRRLGFIPTDPDAWKEKLSTRFSVRSSGQIGAISERVLTTDLEHVVDAMRQYRPDLPVRQSRPDRGHRHA